VSRPCRSVPSGWPGLAPSIPMGGASRSPSEPSSGECGVSSGADSAQTTSAVTIASGAAGGQRRSRRCRARTAPSAEFAGAAARLVMTSTGSSGSGRDRDHDEHGQTAQLEGGPVPLRDEVHRGAAKADRAAEVALQRAGHEPPVLDGPGAIEAQVGAHQRDVGLCRLRRHHDLDRVAGQTHEREDDDRHHEHRHDRLDQPSGDVALHGRRGPPAISSRARSWSPSACTRASASRRPSSTPPT